MRKSGTQNGLVVRRWWFGYAVAVAGTLIAALARWALGREASDLTPYITFYPVAFAAAMVGGTRPGLLATVLSVLAANVLFMEPVGKIGPATVGQALGMALFVGINTAVSILAGRLRAKSDALQETETRLQMAHQAAHIGAFEWNLQTGINLWSPELEAMYGLKPGEFSQTEPAWEQLVHPEDRARAVAAVQRALATFKPEEGEWRAVWANGEAHWLVGRFQAFKDANGHQRLVGVNIDITERKQTEEALKEREEWFRTMADAIPHQAWIARADGYIFWFNRRCFEYTGLGHEELEGWGWQRVHDPEVLPRVLERWRRCIATGERFDMEFPVRGADGRFRTFLTLVLPLKNKEGQVMRWFGTHTDVTEARDRERALGRQARLIDLAPAATFVRKQDGTITFWSHGAERLYGWSKTEAVGRRTDDLLHTQFPEGLESIVAKLRAGGPWIGELRQNNRDGEQIVVQSYWLAELDSKGEVEELLESNMDVTERKRLQEHLEQAVGERTARLRDAISELEYMSYSMVHDMRAPLRAMQSFAAIVQEDCAELLHPRAADYLQRICESAQRLDCLITDALNYNHVVIQKPPLKPVDLGELLRGMVQTYPNLQGAKIALEFDELVVVGNQSLLTQCFGNLLDNAVKFVAQGVKPHLRVWAESSTIDNQPATSICIEDNGIGIPREAHEKIFRMFQRMHAEGVYPGTGIGLAIVRKAVERMNGRISIESEPGKGTRFHIDLPRPIQPESNALLHAAA